RLPIKIAENEQGLVIQPSEGGLATGLASIHAQGNNRWIGWPGISIDDEQKQAYFAEILNEKRLTPLFLNEEEIKGFYEGFSNEVLWPIFHYFSNFAN